MKNKEIIGALELDIYEWLSNNRNLTYETKLSEIINSLKPLNLSKENYLQFIGHLLIKVDNAHSVIDREKTFEPLIVAGFNAVTSSRANASKKRTGGSNKLVTDAKHIMHRSKAQDIPFKNFLQSALNGNVDGLEILQKDALFLVRTDDSDLEKAVKEATLRYWYAKS